jgi:Flp pilus assembly protein TadG
MPMLTTRRTKLLAKITKSRTPRFGIRAWQSGQALVELAFVVPLLMILALGVIEIGRYAYIAILIGNAAHAGAAYGAQGHQQSFDSGGIANAAEYDFAGAITGSTNATTTATNGQLVSKLSVSSATSCGCDSSGTVTTFGCTVAAGNPNPGSCVTGRWVVVVTVTASGTFTPLFNYPGIPNPFFVSRTASIPVA